MLQNATLPLSLLCTKRGQK